MPRFLMIAYTSYIYDGRVKRHAEALAQRGDHVDLVSLASTPAQAHNGVNLIGIAMPQYRGSSRAAYLRSYIRFFAGAMIIALRLHRAHRYDAVIVCSMQIRRRKCGTPGAAAAVGMAIEAGVSNNFVDLRVRCETIPWRRLRRRRRAAATGTSRERYGGPKTSANPDCKQTLAPNLSGGIGNQTTHRNLTLNEKCGMHQDGFRISTILTIQKALNQTTTRRAATRRI